MIACFRSLYVNSVKEILPFSHKYFDTKKLMTFCLTPTSGGGGSTPCRMFRCPNYLLGVPSAPHFPRIK